jgi:hypothetical protein
MLDSSVPFEIITPPRMIGKHLYYFGIFLIL